MSDHPCWPRWASNFTRLERPIVKWGCSFWTVESFFQAAKTDDDFDKKQIARSGPRMAKALGRRVAIRPDWERVKVSFMTEALLLKFAPGSGFRRLLDATTGPLVEINRWHDNYWGDCVCSECEHIEGQNVLGLLLVAIRDGQITEGAV